MNAEQLRATLLAHGLERVVDGLMISAMPAVRILVDRVDDALIPIGASKLGGLPDLPAGVDWPAWHEHMAFIGQFNLVAVAPFDRENILPTHGLLSFFYETSGEPLHSERWGLPEDAPYLDDYGLDLSLGWRVLYHDADPATFVRQRQPADLNVWVRYHACTARFATDYTLPDVDGPELFPLGLTSEERYQLIELDHEINRGAREEQGHHLLGYPYNLGGNSLLEAHAGPGIWLNDWVAEGGDQLRAIAQAAADKWRLLLQIDSGGATEMDWGGGGVLHYVIERAALRTHDFTKTWVGMQFL